MTPAERLSFTDRLRACAEVFGRRLSAEAAQLYAHALDDVVYDRLMVALNSLLRTAESGAKFPLPRELRRLAAGRPAHQTGAAAALNRERIRQEWLQAGPASTPASRAAILEEVAPRARDGLRSSWFGLLRRIPVREPGEEG